MQAVERKITTATTIATALVLSAVSGSALAFNSGSTGADGAFSPTTNTELQMPASGVFNFTTVNIPSGVTVTFKKNATNTPVVILASGDITIAGVIDVNGKPSADSGAAGNGAIADDGLPGVGGPGGYDGGRGGSPGSNTNGGNGLGPGAGGAASGVSGSGGGFQTAGGTGNGTAPGGVIYGSQTLLPLIGGSGGGGGAGGANFSGSGGGGGGGAVLIASSGTVSITGYIVANGGAAGSVGGLGGGLRGGGGSGGAIRVVATTISGNGTIAANQGDGVYRGGFGWIRLEAENMLRTTTSGTIPSYYSFATPGPIFVPGLPTLAITSVAGVATPASPTGNADVTLPSNVANPVTVTFTATGIPVGTTIKLTVTPQIGATVTATSSPTSGTTDNATASVSVTLPSGPSVLSATTSYTVTASVGDALSRFAKGERVRSVEIASALQGTPTTTLITVSGKRYSYPGKSTAMPFS